VKVRVGVDIGGTFTDLLALDESTGAVIVAKVPTTPSDQSAGFVGALDAANLLSETFTDIVHGSTVAINALIERRTPCVGVLCTGGHRDTLDLRRLWREQLFGNWWRRPDSLVPRQLRREVVERVLADGTISTPLDEESVRAACEDLASLGVESVAISFLHSFANPDHERRAAEIVAEELPGVAVTVSSDVLPEIREYERTSTTTVSALLKPILGSYLKRLQQRLDDRGSRAPLRIMRSNGGVMTVRGALEHPAATLVSGPAGGVTAAAAVARLIGARDAITFDMGGTSTDVGLIEDGEPVMTMQRELEWDIPVRGPAVEVRTIGAGGGSVAWLDGSGGLFVGPRSAGADPGPACYGLGGKEPTVTDANVVLGRIAPLAFLHGEMKLDPERARVALARIARPFRWSEVEAAAAVWRIAHTNMSLLVRETTINRGFDPRNFTLVSFGGAGGLFAAEIARDLGIPRACVPVHASVFSALGGLLGEITYDFVQTFLAPVARIDVESLRRVCRELAERAETDLRRDGVSPNGAEYRFFVDARYVGEGFELTVPADFGDGVDASALAAVCERFHDRHRQLYSFDRPTEPIELVNVRCVATLSRSRPALATRGGPETSAQPVETRSVYFDVAEGFVETAVFDRARLAHGARLEGPLLLQEPDTVVVVAPGQVACIDDYGNLLVDTAPLMVNARGASCSSPLELARAD
jgi:N-methylhydantoinase A/oxoprolinase/acetone carboxylase beta subunit